MYLSWNKKIITDFDEKKITNLYSQGYVFTRVGKGVMSQTRSLRIDLDKFELSSENRRILRKTENIEMKTEPLPYDNYHWSIHKLGKDFYSSKFGDKTFSANKIKELMTDDKKSNFNSVYIYSTNGYCIAYENNQIIHYSYPFYDLHNCTNDMGLGMMLKAITYAQKQEKKYIYIGSACRPTDTYKIQFKGLQWFDGQNWQEDNLQLKKTLQPKQNKHIHFIGICGVAMSALAIAFNKKNWTVTGSDAGFYPPVSTNLAKEKIDFYPGWHPKKMIARGVPDVVVVGNVASSTNPEWLYVKENNITYYSYPEAVAKYFVAKNSIVCAGTYGKTTTSTLLSWILRENGFNPSYMFGGLAVNPDLLPAKISDSTWSVLEGDEYKTARWDNSPKFSHYSPTHLLLTATKWDHADVYPTEQSYYDAFNKLLTDIPSNGHIIMHEKLLKDDKLIINDPLFDHRFPLITTYGNHNLSDFYYNSLRCSKEGLEFNIVHEEQSFKICSPMIGKFMAENITACFAVAKTIGINPSTITDSILRFSGIQRRLQKKLAGKIDIYDDIAHSPQKALSTLKTLRKIYPKNNIYAIFEPNTGNRRPQSAEGYLNAFVSATTVIIPRLTKIKIDKSNTDTTFDGQMLTAIISNSHDNVIHIAEDEELIKFIFTKTQPGDVVVFLGSHGFRGMIEQLINKY